MKINTKYFDELFSIISFLNIYGLKSATIAGGAIRDALAGKPISDIDVFYKDTEVLDTTTAFLKLYDCKTVENSYPIETFSVTHTLFKKNNNLISHLPIQLIAVKGEVPDWIYNFPHSISRVSLNNKGLLIPVDVLFDFKDKTVFTYAPSEVTPSYDAKIRAKYHDWEFV